MAHSVTFQGLEAEDVEDIEEGKKGIGLRPCKSKKKGISVNSQPSSLFFPILVFFILKDPFFYLN